MDVAKRKRRRKFASGLAVYKELKEKAVDALPGIGGALINIMQHTGQGRISEDQSPEEQLKHFKHWIYAAVDARSTAVAQATLRVYLRLPDGDRVEITEDTPGAGKVVTLLKHPNPFQTQWQFMYKHQVYLDLTGDTYILKDKNALGRIVALWTLMPERISISITSDNEPSYVYRYAPGQEKTFDDLAIAHGLYPDPNSELYGVSPLQAATEAVNVHQAIHESQDKTFQQGAEPSLIIQAEGEVDEARKERISQQLNAKYQGPGNAGKSLLLEGGLKANPWRVNPKEMNYLESAGMNRDELLSVYKTSAAILGLSQDVNRSSAEALEYMFAKWTVTPLLKQWQDLLTDKVCKPFDERLFCEYDSIIPLDEEGIHKRRVESISSALMTPNEGREEMGLEPADDDTANSLLAPANLLPIAQLGVEPEAAPAPGGEEAAVPVRVKQDEPMPAGWDPGKWVNGAVDWDDEAHAMADKAAPAFTFTWDGGWDLELALVPDAGELPEFDALLDAYLRGKDFKYFDVLLESTRTELGETLAEGLREGETARQLRDRVQEVYAASETRAERIARTEAMDAQNDAAQKAREALKVPFKFWTAIFLNTRQSHSDAHGQIVRNDQYFDVGGHKMFRPGDRNAPLDEVVNCNCTALGTFEEKAIEPEVVLAYGMIAKSVRRKGESGLERAIKEAFKIQGELVLAAFDELREEIGG